MSLGAKRARTWALSVAAAALVAGSSGVVLRPWALLVTVAVMGGLVVAVLPRGVRWPTQLSWCGSLLLWGAADALLRPVSLRAAAAALAVGVIAALVLLVAQDYSVRTGAHPALVLAAGVAACWLLAERLFLGGRPGGPFANPNLGAAVAALGLAVVPGLAVPLGARLAVAAVLVGGVVASGSRAAMLAVLGVGLAWGFKRGGRAPRWGVALLACTAAAGLALRVATDRDPLRYERLRIWGVAVRTTVAELPLGAGPGGYYDAALAHNFPRSGEFARYHRVAGLAENDLLQLAATLGIPGLLLGLGLVFVTARVLARRGPLGWGVGTVLAVLTLFHSHLAFPAVAWPAALAVAGCGRPLPGRRFRLERGASLAAAAALLLPVAVALGVGGEGPLAPGALPPAVRLTGHAMRSDAALADAEAVLWGACAARPRAAHLWRALGTVQLQRGELRNDPDLVAAALHAFARASAANPTDALAAFGAARAQRLLGNQSAAFEALSRAVSLEPNFVSAWLEMARGHVERGDLPGAARALRRAEHGLALARASRFVSDYERALAAADPALLRWLRETARGS